MRRHDQNQARQTYETAARADVGPAPGDPGVGWTIAFLAEHLDARGRAVISYARIVCKRHRIDLRAALPLARDVLTGETADTCEALFVLLESEWEGTLGDALAAARRV
jgi:hypothetical protein